MSGAVVSIPRAGSRRWHEERRTVVGASESPIVLGLSTWASPVDLWAWKVGLEAPPPENENTARGHLLEQPIARMYERRTGRRLTRDRQLFRHPRHLFLGCHIDRRADDRLVEIKSSAFGRGYGDPDDPDGVPADVRVQGQHEMAVTGATRCDVVVLIGGHDLRIYELEPDAVMVEGIVEECATFWQAVESGQPPAIDGSDAARAYLDRRYGRPDGTALPATPAQDELVRIFRAARLVEAAASDARKLAENRVVEAVGGHSALVGAGYRMGISQLPGKVSWKGVAESLSGSVDAAAYAALLERHTGEPSKRFNPTWKGDPE